MSEQERWQLGGKAPEVYERRVPEDVAVVGYDNIRIAEWYDPSLTTVDQPRYQMGKRAMQALLKRIENPNDPAEMVKLETSLIVRRSSGGLKVRMPPLYKC